MRARSYFRQVFTHCTQSTVTPASYDRTVLRTTCDSRHKREELTEKLRNHYETNMLTRSSWGEVHEVVCVIGHIMANNFSSNADHVTANRASPFRHTRT